MKAQALAKAYHSLRHEVGEYLHVKLNLENIVSEYFQPVVTRIWPKERKQLEVYVDIVDFSKDELIDNRIIILNSDEVDKFKADPNIQMEILSVDALQEVPELKEEEDEKFEEGEECDCPNCTPNLSEMN